MKFDHHHHADDGSILHHEHESEFLDHGHWYLRVVNGPIENNEPIYFASADHDTMYSPTAHEKGSS